MPTISIDQTIDTRVGRCLSLLISTNKAANGVELADIAKPKANITRVSTNPRKSTPGPSPAMEAAANQSTVRPAIHSNKQNAAAPPRMKGVRRKPRQRQLSERWPNQIRVNATIC